MSLQQLLDPLVRTPGVRGALVVSREDGLIVAGTLMEQVDGRAVAALSASLAGRMKGVTDALGQPEPVLFELHGKDGALFAAPAPSGLLLVAVTSAEADAGPLRRELIQAAERAS